MESSNASECLKAVLGEALVKDDETTLKLYSASITGTTVMPACIAFPSTEEDVIAIVKAASGQGFSLHPVSRGKNFGYGDAQGTKPGQVIVDLSNMQKLAVNEKLAWIKIQPGVTQQQLYKYLSESGSSLQADVTGAGLAASIAGNILERGFGHTDFGDRFAQLINMTVVLPDASVLRTGFGQFENADAADVYRYGTGPSIEGLFSQSPFGIVTEMTIAMMPRPEKMCMFVLSTKNENDIGNIVEAIRTLKLQGIVNSAVHIANKARAVGETDNRLAGAWNLSGSISGPATVVNAKKRVVKKVFNQYIKRKQFWFIGRHRFGVLEWFHRNVRNVDVYAPLKDAWDLQMGIPTDHPLQTLLNDASLESSSLIPAGYNTCFSWINAVCSAERGSVERLLQIVREMFSKHQYEFRVTFTAINPRALIMIANISYNRDEASVNKALEFCRACSRELIAHGFLPYRAGSGSFDKLPRRSAASEAFMQTLKSAIDPKNIFSPGKYNI